MKRAPLGAFFIGSVGVWPSSLNSTRFYAISGISKTRFYQCHKPSGQIRAQSCVTFL